MIVSLYLVIYLAMKKLKIFQNSVIVMDDQPSGKCFLKFYYLERWPASWFKNDLSDHEIRLMLS